MRRTVVRVPDDDGSDEMSKIEEVPVNFKTSDGLGFADIGAATRHQAVLDAMGQLQEAQRAWEIALANEQLTADGQPFSWRHDEYWWLAAPCLGLSTLGTVRFYYDSRVELDLCGHVCIRRPGDADKMKVVFRVGQLYANRKAALRALLEQQEMELRWQQEDHAKVRAEMCHS